MELELIVNKNCELGEGPWWDAQKKCLYWFDGFGNELYEYNPHTKENRTIYTIDQPIGCVIPTKDGGLIVCLQDGIYRLDLLSEELTLLSDIEREIENNRLNDGKCDSRGTLWFGSMSMTANQEDREFEVTGSLYSISPDGEIKKHFGDVGISNGIAWNKQETIIYYVDTNSGCVAAFDFDGKHRELSNKRIVAVIPKDEGMPDGMTIDSDGMLWVAHFSGGQVSRWNPEKCEKIGCIKLPVTNVTSCCFGGEGLDELYITTAKTGLSKEQLRKEPLAGCLFRAMPGVTGTELYKFGA